LVCILLAVGYAAASAAFTKHHTAAAGA
jgi:hypothetical protein